MSAPLDLAKLRDRINQLSVDKRSHYLGELDRLIKAHAPQAALVRLDARVRRAEHLSSGRLVTR